MGIHWESRFKQEILVYIYIFFFYIHSYVFILIMITKAIYFLYLEFKTYIKMTFSYCFFNH
jgi:hypothetical protein